MTAAGENPAAARPTNESNAAATKANQPVGQPRISLGARFGPISCHGIEARAEAACEGDGVFGGKEVHNTAGSGSIACTA